MPERTREEARSKREAILEAARELFARKGYEETTIAEIAQAAGVAVGTVYLYFHNKHEVLTGVSLSLGSSIVEALSDPVLLQIPFEEAITKMIDSVFRIGSMKKDVMSLTQVMMKSPEEIQQKLHNNQQITGAIDHFFQEAITQGKLKPFHTQMYAQILSLIIERILLQCFAVEQGERETLYRQYTIELLERLFFGPSLQEGQQSIQ
jgi:AcrR family transcriptional regulator